MSEMNAARLHVIKDAHRRRIRLSTEAIDFLIEQTEQVPELESEKDKYKRLHKSYLDKFTSAVGERNRLREALETIEIKTKDAHNRREDYRRVAREALEELQ